MKKSINSSKIYTTVGYSDVGDCHAGRILIVDFGSQYTQLIARRVRELGVFSEIVAWDRAPVALTALLPAGIILSGGPESVTGDETPRIPDAVLAAGVPILGLCYGMQALALQLGGTVEASDEKEFGHAALEIVEPTRLLAGIEDRLDEAGRPWLDVWMSHGDRVSVLPPGFSLIGRTASAPIAAMGDDTRRIYGLQFHPEVTHTPQGMRLLERFVHDICGAAATWTTETILDDLTSRVQQAVGKDQVLLGLSGGVDSAVVAALLHRAIGDRLVCIFVDTGLLRHGEAEQVMATFGRHFGIRVIKAEAGGRFLAALAGISDPERKRKVIGGEFIAVFEAEAAKLSGIRWLAQGTIYPDVIESAGAATGKAKVIKSHHNVGGLPERMHLKLLEPLRELFKDEVRKLGAHLGLPRELIERHPFPGPGLAVRILGAVEPEYVDLVQRADRIFIEELRRAGLYDKVAQAFTVFLPVKSVGVVGDGRRYEYVVALRAVETVDFMTARAAHLPWDFLDHVTRRIINEISGISRVVYDTSGKPPATIEWE